MRHLDDWVQVQATDTFIGSTADEVDACVSLWKNRLVDPRYSEQMFQSWIQKEYPAHPVQLASFRISKFPITNFSYSEFCLATGARKPESVQIVEPQDHPVWGVELEEAERFCSWLSTQTGRSFRLPSEKEWEYVARGPARLEYPYGRHFDPTRANTLESGLGRTTPVDRYSAWSSPLGVCDLAGNIEEWVSDVYQPYPGGQWIHDDLVQRLGERYRVLRGGSFARGGDLSRGARRHGRYPSAEYRYTGFRVAESLEPTQQNVSEL